MLFFSQESGAAQEENLKATKGVIDQLKALNNALKDNVVGPEVVTIYKNVEATAISIADKAKALQRSMGGVVIESDKFAAQLIGAYKDTVNLGVEFKDITAVVDGLASSMGRMVRPSQETVVAMATLSKSTGVGASEVGKMVGELGRFGGTQLQVTEQMHKLAGEARKIGLDSKAFLTNVTGNLKIVNGFGFNNSVKGLKDMVKQAMMLRTSIDSIGAAAIQSKVLDPEGAIEMAANFQMLGGAIGKLGDPFQLMYMAQSDMKGLQDEIINSTKSVFTFNKATGGFDVSTADMYKLREQANLMGKSLDEVVQTGREAAKMDYLKERFSLSGLDEESLNLVTGLSEIGPDGKVTIDIPGYGKIAEDQINSTEAQKALKKYMEIADDDEKTLAQKNLTISETQAKDVNIIKTAILTQMGLQDRANLIKDIREMNEATGKIYTDAAKTAGKETGKAVSTAISAQSDIVDQLPSPPYTDEDVQKMNDLTEKLKTIFQNPNDLNDGLIPSNGSAPVVLSKGALYKGIVGDDVAMGVGLTDALSKGGGGNLTGAIDVNINLNGSINGDPGQISQMFNSPQIQKQIMDTVLYKLNDYKRQQGVIS